MSPRSRPYDHEAPWARELSRAQSPALERQAAFTEEKLRAEGHNLAEVRAEWARFSADNPLGGEAIHQQYIRATNLAYARIVDDLLRQETGEGLRERHAPSLGEFDRCMDEVPALEDPANVHGRLGYEALEERETALREAAGLRDARPLGTGGQNMRSRESDTDQRHKPPAPSDRPTPELPGADAALRPASLRPLSDAERRQVQAEADEAFLRGVAAAQRPSEVPPEAWYAERARALDDDARASVEREVTRLSPLPQLSTAEAVRRAVEQTTAEFERPHEQDTAKLRTRLYALSLLHEARVDAERTTSSDAQTRTKPQRDLTSHTEPRAITPDPPLHDHNAPTPRELTATEPLRLWAEAPREAPDRPERDIAEATTAISPRRSQGAQEAALEAERQALETEARTQPGAFIEPKREAPEVERTERDFFPAERAEAAYARSEAHVPADAPGNVTVDRPRPSLAPYRFNPDEQRPYDSDVHNVAKHMGYDIPPSLIQRLEPQRRPEETLELHTRDLLELRTDPDAKLAPPSLPRSPSSESPRETERELSLEERLSERVRLANAHRYRDLGEIAADGERAFFLLQREGLYDDQARQEAEAIEAAIVDVRASLKTYDPLELAERAMDLQSREQSADPEHAKVLGRIRLGYASLATDAFYRQSLLLARMAKDCISEVQRLSEDDQAAFIREATLRLSEPAYNDRLAMGKELLRVDAQTATASERHLQRICAVARQATSLSHLSGAAGWSGPAFSARVEAEVNQRLLEREHDPELHRALAERRVMWTLSEDENQKDAFFAEAKFIAEVLRRLPDARREQVETSPR